MALASVCGFNDSDFLKLTDFPSSQSAQYDNYEDPIQLAVPPFANVSIFVGLGLRLRYYLD